MKTNPETNVPHMFAEVQEGPLPWGGVLCVFWLVKMV